MHRFWFAVACLFAGLCASALAAEMVDNPSYQNWAKYKVGTSVTHLQEMQMAGPMAMTMSSEMKQTLAELTPEQAVLETAMTSSMMPGREQKHRVNLPAKIEKEKASVEATTPQGLEKVEVKQLGNETVKVNEKEYNCQVTQFSGEQRGMKATGKSWTSPEVPGNMVKLEMTSASAEGGDPNTPKMGMTMKMGLKSFEIK